MKACANNSHEAYRFQYYWIIKRIICFHRNCSLSGEPSRKCEIEKMELSVLRWVCCWRRCPIWASTNWLWWLVQLSPLRYAHSARAAGSGSDIRTLPKPLCCLLKPFQVRVFAALQSPVSRLLSCLGSWLPCYPDSAMKSKIDIFHGVRLHNLTDSGFFKSSNSFSCRWIICL